MRQYLVLGFLSNSANAPGECLYLGTDRGAAMEKVNEPGEYARRELYDLATPQIRRHSAVEPELAPDKDADGAPEESDEAPDQKPDPDKTGNIDPPPDHD